MRLSEEMKAEEAQLMLLKMPLVLRNKYDEAYYKEGFERGQAEAIRKYLPKVKALEEAKLEP